MSRLNRRRFLSNSASGLAAGAAVAVSGSGFVFGQSPAIHTTSKTGNDKLIGEGDYQYQISHDYFKLPNDFKWQTTHDACFDKE